jgi:hypothetical protein
MRSAGPNTPHSTRRSYSCRVQRRVRGHSFMASRVVRAPGPDQCRRNPTRVLCYDTFGSTHGRDEQRVLAELPSKLKALGVDAVISGMAC